MRLSIVTPSYNQGHLIGQTLASFLQQPSGLDLEVIIVDGLSTDNTASVVAHYIPKMEARGIRTIFISEKDRGQSDAINKGSRLASGQILTYLNSDDYYQPDVLGRVLETFEHNPKARWGFGGWRFVNEAGKLYSVGQPKKFSRRRLSTVCTIVQPSCFYTKDFFDEVGAINETLHYGMDYDLWLRMAAQSKPLVLPLVISNARYHAAAKSSTSTKKQLMETWRLQRQHTRGWLLRLEQLYYFVRGWAVILVGRDISRRIENKRNY